MTTKTFTCSRCQNELPIPAAPGGTGYALDDDGEKICYDCCAELDKQWMLAHGKIALYLTCEPASKARLHGRPFTSATANICGRKTAGEVTNWPGTLRFPCHTRTGGHNIAGVRYDCWFTGPDGYEWHGVTIGDNTQICRCKRTKTKIA